MKEYLKMGGYFSGSVEINANGQICDDKNFRGSTDIAEDYYLPICHAINSHDELVQMNNELLAALEALFHETNQRNLLMADKVITKAKGGAQ